MKLGRVVSLTVLCCAVGFRAGGAALREPPAATDNAARVIREAKAEQPSPAPRTLQAVAPAASAPAVAGPDDSGLRREVDERLNVLSARFDALDTKIYEIVGRLQLLAVCLIVLFLGLAVWQISITRQIAQLRYQGRSYEHLRPGPTGPH